MGWVQVGNIRGPKGDPGNDQGLVHGPVSGAVTLDASIEAHILSATGPTTITMGTPPFPGQVVTLIITGGGKNVIVNADDFPKGQPSLDDLDVVNFVAIDGKTWWCFGTGAPLPPDTAAPSAPTSLSVASKADVKATITVTGAVDDRAVTQYRWTKDGGTTWTIASASGTGFVAVGLSASTTYTIRAQAGDAAGNWSASSPALTFTTAATPPAAYQQTALALSPLHYYAGSTAMNLGSRTGVHIDSTGSPGTGAALGGFSSSYHLSSDASGVGTRFAIQAADGLQGLTKYAASVIVRLNAVSTSAAYDMLIYFAPLWLGGSAPFAAGQNGASLAIGSDATKGEFRVGEQALPTQAATALPLPTPRTYVLGLDCDGTTLTYYVNGQAVKTAAAVTTNTGNQWQGVTAISQYNRINSASIDWAGLLIHDNTIGAAAHAQLAQNAGVS